MSIYDFQGNSLLGESVQLSAFRGKVLLIVNTASQCSYSRQFADLQKLYDSRRDRGFEILAFPCNQFNDKEPGDSLEIKDYCETNFSVTFPLFEKIDVRGPSAHPLFQYLTEQAPYTGFDAQSINGLTMQDFVKDKYPEVYAGDGVKWNFSKFLIDRNGRVKARYEVTTQPLDLMTAVDELL